MFKLIASFSLALAAMAQTSTFPTTPATDTQLKVQVNGKTTTLTVAMNNSVTSATVASCSGIPANSLATINTEIVAVLNCSGNTLNLATASNGCTNGRACDNTAAASHVSGATVSWFVEAWHHNALRAEVEALESALSVGASPTFVNITASSNVSAKAVNFNDNSGVGISGHFGMDAVVQVINKSLSVRDTSGNIMFTFDAANAANQSLLNLSVGSGPSNKNLSVNGAISATSASLFSIGIAGRALSGTTTYSDPNAIGVYGSSLHDGYGVYGASLDAFIGVGVGGHANAGIGVEAFSSTGRALSATSGTGYDGYFGAGGIYVANGGAYIHKTAGIGPSPGSGGYGLAVETTTSGGGILVTAANSTVITGSTTSSTSAVLSDSGGTCQIHGASGISCVSDRSLKTGIRDIAPSLSKVLRLRPVEYQMKSDGQHAAGLIAQEVRDQFPLAVGTTEDGKLTLAYQEIVPYLIKAIQERQGQIAELKARK